MIRAFVAGHPVAHSRSPLIHGFWLREHGLAGSYERVDVAPGDMESLLARVRTGEFAGGNVTVPLKEEAYRLVDQPTGTALRLGAVNTIWREDGRLAGHNTDGAGYAASLDEAVGPDWARPETRALILGAGGAARAVVGALLDRGLTRLAVANRTDDRADALAEDLGREVESIAWTALGAALPACGLLVNTTVLGMDGQPALDLSLDGLPAGAIVSDIVYVPLETPLLAAARARGLRAVDGLGMLLHQAVPGFERWFGVRPAVTPALRAFVEADLAR